MITHDKNLTYFDTIDTEEKAYFLGLLYADGTISRLGFVLSLQKPDRHILEHFSQAVFNKIHLREIPPRISRFKVPQKGKTVVRSHGAYVLAVHSTYMAAALIKLGATPAKSLTLRFPTEEQVPTSLLRHFIRGYFDGDGCLSCRKSCRAYMVDIQSSEGFCDALCGHLNPLLGINFVRGKRYTRISSIHIGGNRQVKVFMDWLYEGATVFLHRKRAKYDDLSAVVEESDLKVARSYSRYPGVTYDKRRGCWISYAEVNGHTRTFGGGHLTEEAAHACRKAFLKEHGLSDKGSKWAARRIAAKQALHETALGPT